MPSLMTTVVAISLAAPLLVACASAAPASPASPMPSPATAVAMPMNTALSCTHAATSDVTTNNGVGDLHGTLTAPLGCGARPFVLVVPGSGPTDRDGNGASGLRTDAYKLLADALAKRGIGSLRYDKAGIAASKAAAPREDAMRFEAGADDAARWVAFLKRDQRVASVSIVGHSEGALVGMLAAAREPVVAFVSIAGPGRAAGAALREQLAAKLPKGELLDRSTAILDGLEKGVTTSDPPRELAALFRPSVQPYLISWMAHDPAVEIRAVHARVLIVQGTTDTQVGVGDAERLKSARPDAELRIVDGMAHSLKIAANDPASQRDAYTNPQLPIAPAMIESLEAFVLAPVAP